MDDGSVRCPHCGSEHVARQEQTPRLKAYLDEHGQRQTVEVYRYYCKNPDCPYQTFTNLPPGLIAYSVWTLDARLKALELYTGLRTNYRSAANALGVAPSTLYHWLDQFGAEPLQVAALFGLVRSSGVVGIDEKYVKVPKNNKPAGKQRKWMYVYVAVDVHTLDLLHIAIFPHLGKDSARTFLLELRAKGYHPRVIVTDMNQDYTEPLHAVFPNAVHHECVFHALQYWHRCFKDAFGRDYEQTHPDIFKLRQQMDHIFQAKTRRTVEKRYAELMAQRDQLVQTEPRLRTHFRQPGSPLSQLGQRLRPPAHPADQQRHRAIDPPLRSALPKLCRLRFPRDRAVLPALVRVDLSLHALRPRGAAASARQVSARTGRV